MAHSVFSRAVITATAVLAANSVMAVFSVEVRVDNILVDTISDNIFPDQNPAVGDIHYHFVLLDQNNIWQAEGDVFAEGGFNGQPPVSTVVTNTLIEKISNDPIIAGEIDFTHSYAPQGCNCTQLTSMESLITRSTTTFKEPARSTMQTSTGRAWAVLSRVSTLAQSPNLLPTHLDHYHWPLPQSII